MKISQDRNRNRFREYKESNPCTDCEKYYPYYVMQFDHKVDKLFTVGLRSASYGSKRVLDEIAKCDLVCSNCHAERTFKRKNGSVAESGLKRQS